MKFLRVGLVSFHSGICAAKKASHTSKENCEKLLLENGLMGGSVHRSRQPAQGRMTLLVLKGPLLLISTSKNFTIYLGFNIKLLFSDLLPPRLALRSSPRAPFLFTGAGLVLSGPFAGEAEDGKMSRSQV
jgi:hypothetical protein